MPRRRHHVVSRSYQRQFARGRFIELIDKTTRTSKPVSTRDAFVEKGFVAVRSDLGTVDYGAEDEWSRIEGIATPAFRAAIGGDRGVEALRAVKVVACLHWARSYGTREVWNRVHASHAEEARREFATKPVLIAAWKKQYGRAPEPGDIEAIVDKGMADMLRQNALFVEKIGEYYNKAVDKFGPMYVQFVRVARPRAFGLLTGDNPVVLMDETVVSGVRLHRVGSTQIALNDARTVYFPLTREQGVFFTTKPEDDAVAVPLVVQKLNHYMWRSCVRFLACHPDEDWTRALGMRGRRQGVVSLVTR